MRGRVLGVWLMVMACSGKDDSGTDATGDGAVCEPTDMSDPDCESGTAVLRVAVTVGGAAAPSGTTVHVQDCDGADNTAAADAFGEARFNIPAATYVIWADNSAEGVSSEPQTHDIPGCGTTSLDLSMGG